MSGVFVPVVIGIALLTFAIWLLAGLAAAWVLIGIWQLLRYLKQKKEKEALKKKG